MLKSQAKLNTGADVCPNPGRVVWIKRERALRAAFIIWHRTRGITQIDASISSDAT
jgi:hypothetical protein